MVIDSFRIRSLTDRSQTEQYDRTILSLLVMPSVESKLQHPPPPGIPRAFDTFAVPGRRVFDYETLLRGWGIRSPCFRGGELELYPRFHWGRGVSGKDCAFVANWLRGKDINKLCAVFEGIFNIFNIGIRL